MDRAPGTVSLLEAIVADSPVGLGFWDLELRFRHANPALRRMAGMGEDQAIEGMTPSQVLGPMGVELERLLAGVVATEEGIVPHSISAATSAGSVRRREWVGAYHPVFAEGGRLLGVAGLIRESVDERGSGADLQRALQVAIVARTEAETARTRTAFVAQAGARMATSMDANQALRQLARAAVPEAADWCTVSMIGRDGRLETVAVAHHDAEREPRLWAMTERRPLHVADLAGPAAALRERRALLRETVDDAELRMVAGDDLEHLEQMRGIGIGSSLIVPLLAPDRPLGTITFVYAQSGRRYGPEDVAMAEALAAWAALHVENARLYTERSHIASTLQEGLQPTTLPEIPGLELAVRYRAAGVENAVGGDFYDVFERPGGGWSAVVGDVSGKGADAAALTALARHTYFAGALQGGDAEANLRLVNAALLRRSGPEGFCTAVALDVRSQVGRAATVHLANGGHPAPLLLRADGRVEETVASGTLIGAVEEIALEVQEIVLEPGDALVVFTDGAIELRGEDPGDGARVLREALADATGAAAAELADAVQRQVVAAAGGELRDDLALLVLRAPAEPG
jgi:serine phosphatase RsbU (regulator of sigma subunit)